MSAHRSADGSPLWCTLIVGLQTASTAFGRHNPRRQCRGQQHNAEAPQVAAAAAVGLELRHGRTAQVERSGADDNSSVCPHLHCDANA